MDNGRRIVLTGFMGVGKTTVARHLSYILRTKKIDLDTFIESNEKQTIFEIVENHGIARFRQMETESLSRILIESDAKIIALGGGAWTTAENRDLIQQHECMSLWLEATFAHCWRNISLSKRKRPLARNKKEAKKLFDERLNFYCLADWHFIVRPDLTSFDIARQIAEEVFLFEFD